MTKFLFQLSIKRASLKRQTESLTCTALLRAIPGRREVYDALWNNQRVIVKVFSHKIRARRHLKREWRGLSLLQARGLSSPETLFYGQTENGRWAVVVKKIPDSSTILDLLSEMTEKPKKIDLLVLVCKELAKEHGKGVLQKDLHLGNFLLGGDKVSVLDPAQMQFLSRPVTRKRSISQLALLVCCSPVSDIESITRLCEEYACARGWRFGKSDEALFQKRLTVHRKRTIGRGLKKCLRTSTRHLRIKAGKHLAVFNKGFCQGAEPLDFIEQIDALMDKGEILKKGSTCYVSRVEWNGRDVVVKRYNHKGFIHSLRHTIKGSRAMRGWLQTHRLEMLNVATPKPLAYVEKCKGLLVWESYLITEYIEGQRLCDLLGQSNVTEEERSKITRQVRELLDMLGSYKISHGDLKHSNILIAAHGPYIIDLDAMKVHRWKWSYKVRRAKDITRFLRKTDSRRKFAGDFVKMRMYNWMIYSRKDFTEQNIRKLALAVDKSNESLRQFAKVPSSRYTRVFRCNIVFNGVGQNLYLKQFLYRSVWDFIKHLFRSSRAKRAFKASLMLQRNGFDTPAVIGLFERRRLGLFCTNNVLVTRDVEDAKPVQELFTDICQSSTKDALVRKRALIKAFAQMVGRIHAKGIFHGDLRLGNILVRKEEDKWQFFLIDNERTKEFCRLPIRLRLKNIIEVNRFRDCISNTDRMRFLKGYIKENADIQHKYKSLARKVVSKAADQLKTKVPTGRL